MKSTTTQAPRRPLVPMAATYCLGVFNDNYFKQAAMLLAVSAGLNQLQGWATVLFALPFILFAAHGGWCADRFAKKRVVVFSKALEVGAMATGAIGLLAGNWFCILAMVFLMGLQSTFFSPALNGAVPELYPEDQVPKVNAVLKLTTTLAILAGVATAGISLDQHWFEYQNFSPGILLVAITTLCVATGGFLASLALTGKKSDVTTKPFPWFGPFDSLRDLREICRDREFLLAIVSDAWFYCVASFTVLTINTLGLNFLGFSQTKTSLLSVCLMLGICLGSFVAARRVKLGNWSADLVISAIGMAFGLLLAGLTIFIPVAGRFAWLCTALLACGIAGGIFLIPVTSFLQVRPDNSEKGRVLAASGFSSFVAIMFSGQLFNLLENRLSPSTLLIIAGLLGILMAIILLFLKPGKSVRAKLIASLLKRMLALRYRITLSGLETIRPENDKGILFLPNHPALIDPVIVMSAIYDRFTPRPLSEAAQVDKPVIRSLMRSINPILLPTVGRDGNNNREQVHAAIDTVVASLRQGDNILFYPAGRLTRNGREELAGKSGVEYIVRQIPDLQTVLVRTSGLWGSSFSRACGTPSLFKMLRTYIFALVANGLFFLPKREVTVEFVRDHRLATLPDRTAINTYLESHYNADSVTRTEVPFFRWQGKTTISQAGDASDQQAISTSNIPDSIREQVTKKIGELCGLPVTDSQNLANDLGLDSLSIMELSSWLEQEFGHLIHDPAALQTVADCILAADGRLLNQEDPELNPPPSKWFAPRIADSATFGNCVSIPEAFLKQALRNPNKVIIADRIGGPKTYRDILTAIFALKPFLDQQPGERIGIMLPASVSSTIVYLTALFSGKTPVTFNWTVGHANIAHGIAETGVQCIISASPLCKKVEEQQGINLQDLDVEWLQLDQLLPAIGLADKAQAFIKAHLFAKSLACKPIPDDAVILFTSGSESRPKAVPLSHANILANLTDFTSTVHLGQETRLLGILPPFHSLGLTGTIIMPLCLGIPTVYHANPTESATLAKLIDIYQATMLISTPTFLGSILQAGSKKQLESLQLVFTGAEKCPESVMHALKTVNQEATLCEGYGITECSPLVSINTPGDNGPGTIGRLLSSIEYAIVDDNCGQKLPTGERGLLLVRGPNIFRGYLNQEATAGFCEFMGKRWYQTGDYVVEDTEGRLVFSGRKKRFVKIGGEMISLPAIEDVLLKNTHTSSTDGPPLAIEATDNESHPEIVLFTTIDLDRSKANSLLREAGLSPLHNIRQTIRIETIPVLGTGKTDYRQLKKMLVQEEV
ncbi:MFS transporter [Desulfopila aestuarii]|uniref:Acyl-CoA synthetase (AMP-forming)/AMP-acid ligase II n=1 Tax=Desulfopila aestuarii DSM 18488 TaxID=1121416 RepID=A0A1M7YB41_9BACT|nr:MFS transporter [Desulfopila aestuarii]SHO49870.1 Acyl-CoA synthetase (AMP-forming)/AMP-acid ligase II [Desulfopila aestuarii DSM 18488]